MPLPIEMDLHKAKRKEGQKKVCLQKVKSSKKIKERKELLVT